MIKRSRLGSGIVVAYDQVGVGLSRRSLIRTVLGELERAGLIKVHTITSVLLRFVHHGQAAVNCIHCPHKINPQRWKRCAHYNAVTFGHREKASQGGVGMLNKTRQMFSTRAACTFQPVFGSPFVRVRPSHKCLHSLMRRTQLALQRHRQPQRILLPVRKSFALFRKHFSPFDPLWLDDTPLA